MFKCVMQALYMHLKECRLGGEAVFKKELAASYKLHV